MMVYENISSSFEKFHTFVDHFSHSYHQKAGLEWMVAFHYYLSMLRASIPISRLAQSVVRLLAMMVGPGSNLFDFQLFCLFAFTHKTCGKYFEMYETSRKS